MSKRRGIRPADQLELKEAPPPAPPGRGPVILPLGPRNFGIAQWVRDEGTRVPDHAQGHPRRVHGGHDGAAA
jgi:hypothetical protein